MRRKWTFLFSIIRSVASFISDLIKPLRSLTRRSMIYWPPKQIRQVSSRLQSRMFHRNIGHISGESSSKVLGEMFSCHLGRAHSLSIWVHLFILIFREKVFGEYRHSVLSLHIGFLLRHIEFLGGWENQPQSGKTPCKTTITKHLVSHHSDLRETF